VRHARVGDGFARTVTLSAAGIGAFAAQVGGTNPLHPDAELAARDVGAETVAGLAAAAAAATDAGRATDAADAHAADTDRRVPTEPA
jgi:acyl dehydratase